MRIGDRYVANVARGDRGSLRGVLRINLVCRGGYLHLFVDFLRMVQPKGHIVHAGMERQRLARQKEKSFGVYLDFVVTRCKISEDKAPGLIGVYAANDPAGTFQFDSGRGHWNSVLVQ